MSSTRTRYYDTMTQELGLVFTLQPGGFGAFVLK